MSFYSVPFDYLKKLFYETHFMCQLYGNETVQYFLLAVSEKVIRIFNLKQQYADFVAFSGMYVFVLTCCHVKEN